MLNPFKKNHLLVILSFSLLALFCTTRSSKRVKLLTKSTSKQDYEKTIKSIRKSPELYGERNEFLYWFDLGILFHYIGEYDSSLFNLEKAEAVLDELYARSVLNEAASLLTNDNLRPYRAKRYEQILLHQFLAFNYLAKDEYDEALVEMRKVQLVFDRFKSKDEDKDKYNDDGMAHFLSSVLYDAQDEHDNGVISLYKSVSAYQNGPIPPPADVKGLAYYRLLHDEREDDIVALNLETQRGEENIPGLYKNHQSEIVLIGYAGESPILEETIFWGTYVVDGLLIVHYRNPNGDTVTATMPAPPIPERKKDEDGEETLSGTTFHIKFALPTMVKRESRADHFLVSIEKKYLEDNTDTTITADTASLTDTTDSTLPADTIGAALPTDTTDITDTTGLTDTTTAYSIDTTESTDSIAKENIKSTLLTDTDLLLEKDLIDNHTVTIVRTALRVVLRTISSQKAKKELRTDKPLVNLFVNLGTDVATDQLEKADTRMCFFLPKSIHITRIPVEPGSHRLEVSVISEDGSAVDQKTWENIAVEYGQKKFIFYPALK